MPRRIPRPYVLLSPRNPHVDVASEELEVGVGACELEDGVWAVESPASARIKRAMVKFEGIVGL